MLRTIPTPFFLLFFLCFFAKNTLAQNRDISYMSSGGKLHPLQANMDIRHYTIILDVDIDKKTIAGFTEIDMILSKPSDTILLDLVYLLKIEKVKANDKPVNFQHVKDKIYITSTGPFQAGKQKITIYYGGEPPVAVKPPWFGGFTWTKDRSGNPWVAINCQKEGGRLYFPCKDHPSDEPNEGVDLFITVPASLVVAGPGLLMDVKTKKEKKTFHWKTNYTISNYCILFNIGKYEVISKDYKTIDGNIVPIQYYVLQEDTAQAKKIIELKERDSRVLEKYFGEYPWVKEKIGIAAVPNPGMEHQTMITFQNKFDYTDIGGQPYSANLFHEYAHEWFANKVTNKDWAHMWIQEGIATYAEALIHFELGGQAAYDDLINRHRRSIRAKKPMVGAEELSEDETYNGNDIYTKGSFFMHSLRYVLGDEIFLPTLKKLATDPKYTYDQFVTTQDVEQLFSMEAKQDLKPLFDFYTRTNDVLDIAVKEVGAGKFSIKLNNFFMALPMDITTEKGTTKMLIPKEGITVQSAFPPQVDLKNNYLKKISIQ
ncbi:MAG: M1 family metallopeptidase [Saprospiraceae bacterium]|nr:M1 family metallopeptidase [Saprospiraceae bacterium]